jgi:hypothetical protein
MAKKSRNPWLKTWKLMDVDGTVSALKSKKGSNTFQLVAASRTGKRINAYKVKSKNGAMTKYWKDCVFVPRGAEPVVMQDIDDNPLGPLGPESTAAEMGDVVRKMLYAIDMKHRIRTARLECDLRMPAGGQMCFGSLQLFQIPKGLGSEALLAVSFSVDRGPAPGGSGNGGSVTD